MEKNKMLEDIEFIEYEDKYREKIIEFLIEITIGEFGYSEWENYFRTKDFTSYENGKGKFIIALKDKKIIGTCAALKKTENEVKLNTFYILKEYRKSGLGNQMYNMILDYIVENRYKEIILCTFEKFDIAIRFYEKRGYKLFEVIDDELWYRKKL